MRRVTLLIIALAMLVQACASSSHEEATPVSSRELEIEKNYGNRFLRSLFEDEPSDVIAGPLDPKSKQILKARGEYLVTGPAACGYCHGRSDSPGSPLSGGRVLQDRFGTVTAANITPSKTSGVGNWSRGEIVRAIRSSVGKDETPLSLDLHATYRWMSDSDAKAVAVYLLSLEPVESVIERRTLGTFEKNRAGLFSRYRNVEGFIPAPPRAKSSAYGRYLSYHVAGCYGCHTPEGGIVDDAIPFSGVAPKDKSLVGSFKSLFSLLKPKSEQELERENASSMELLSAEAQQLYGAQHSNSEEVPTLGSSAQRKRLGANPKFDEAIYHGGIPVSGPDIRSTGEEGIASWSKQDLMSYLENGKTPGGEQRDGRVCPWPYFERMDEIDREAIASFLKLQ